MADSVQPYHRFAPYEPILWIISAVGFFGLNGVFIYFAVWQPDVMTTALTNPIALVSMVEAFVILAVAAWAIRLHELRNAGRAVFVALSLPGSLAFSIPFLVLPHLRKAMADSRAE